jgi:uncharacterized protein YjbI with pentapeptide repeats
MEPTPDDSSRSAGKTREELIHELERLTAELQDQKEAQRRAAKRRVSFGWFTANIGLRTFAGPQMYQAAVACWDAWSAWLRSGATTGGWPEAATRDFAAALFARFTRIGLLMFVIAAGPFLITMVQLIVLHRQNGLIGQQNALINLQAELTESARRSSLVFEQSAILDEIDEELDVLDTDGPADDSVLSRLSPRLEGRIIALSKSLRPYRYLDGEKLIPNPLSPERGQLLLVLINSKINLGWIISQADLGFADLPGTTLREFDLGVASTSTRDGLRLHGSIFKRAFLLQGSLRAASLGGASFHEADIVSVDFRNAYLNSVDFSYARIDSADFRDASLLANFSRARVSRSKFTSGTLFYQRFPGAYLTDIEIEGDLPSAFNENWLKVAENLCAADYVHLRRAPAALRKALQKSKACVGKILREPGAIIRRVS